MNHNLLIWGTGSHAHVVVEQCRYGSYKLIDDKALEYIDGSWLKKYSPGEWDAFVAIGDNKIRRHVSERLFALGYSFNNVISRDAYISPTVKMGLGVYIAPMACVMTNSVLEDGVIINTGASVDHDGYIEKFAHISPGVHMGGHVHIGQRTWVGVGTSIVHQLEIEDDIIVAGGSSVAEDLLKSDSLYAGNPAVFKKGLE